MILIFNKQCFDYAYVRTCNPWSELFLPTGCDQVQECACPGEPGSNSSFSSDCVMSVDNSIQCSGCPMGFEGKRCEKCSPGYFGDPKSGIPCSPCMCNGNVDPNDPRRCDRLTGKCKCIKRTGGEHCELCIPGTWRDTANRCRGKVTYY